MKEFDPGQWRHLQDVQRDDPAAVAECLADPLRPAAGCGAEVGRDGRVAVNPDVTLPGNPNVFVVGDMIITSHRVKKLAREKFGDRTEKGLGWYAAMRTIQMRFMRLPKPQVKRGGYPV